jgi:hypothetical protein
MMKIWQIAKNSGKKIRMVAMGDRANILFLEDSTVPGIYFYTHWGGSQLPYTLAMALQRGVSRWDDPAYLASIIHCEMTGDDWPETTGFGISIHTQDGDDRVLVVDAEKKMVRFNGHSWTFEEFANTEGQCLEYWPSG